MGVKMAYGTKSTFQAILFLVLAVVAIAILSNQGGLALTGAAVADKSVQDLCKKQCEDNFKTCENDVHACKESCQSVSSSEGAKGPPICKSTPCTDSNVIICPRPEPVGGWSQQSCTYLGCNWCTPGGSDSDSKNVCEKQCETRKDCENDRKVCKESCKPSSPLL